MPSVGDKELSGGMALLRPIYVVLILDYPMHENFPLEINLLYGSGSEGIALDKPPVGNGKGVLISQSTSIESGFPTRCSTKNQESLCWKLQGYLILWFNKYPQNP